MYMIIYVATNNDCEIEEQMDTNRVCNSVNNILLWKNTCCNAHTFESLNCGVRLHYHRPSLILACMGFTEVAECIHE